MPKKHHRIPKGGGTPHNPKRNRKSKKGPKKGDQKTRKYARMLADPCNAPLLGGINGDNAGVHRETMNFEITLQPYGYLVVFPEFCSNASVSPGQGYYLDANGEAVLETQNWDSLFFNNLNDVAPGPFITPDPPADLSASSTAARRFPRPPDSYDRNGEGIEKRCISACLKVTYAGDQDQRQGLFVPIRDVTPAEAVGLHLDSPTADTDDYRSVKEIVTHSSLIVPTQDVMEVKWRGSGRSAHPNAKWHNRSKGAFCKRVRKSDPLITSYGVARDVKDDESVRGMGFAWSGSDSRKFIISYTKVFEVRNSPEAAHRNLAQTHNPKSAQAQSAPSYYDNARAMLRRWNPDWDLVQSVLVRSAKAYTKFTSGNAYMLKNEL